MNNSKNPITYYLTLKDISMIEMEVKDSSKIWLYMNIFSETTTCTICVVH